MEAGNVWYTAVSPMKGFLFACAHGYDVYAKVRRSGNGHSVDTKCYGGGRPVDPRLSECKRKHGCLMALCQKRGVENAGNATPKWRQKAETFKDVRLKVGGLVHTWLIPGKGKTSLLCLLLILPFLNKNEFHSQPPSYDSFFQVSCVAADHWLN